MARVSLSLAAEKTGRAVPKFNESKVRQAREQFEQKAKRVRAWQAEQRIALEKKKIEAERERGEYLSEEEKRKRIMQASQRIKSAPNIRTAQVQQQQAEVVKEKHKAASTTAEQFSEAYDLYAKEAEIKEREVSQAHDVYSSEYNRALKEYEREVNEIYHTLDQMNRSAKFGGIGATKTQYTDVEGQGVSIAPELAEKEPTKYGKVTYKARTGEAVNIDFPDIPEPKKEVPFFPAPTVKDYFAEQLAKPDTAETQQAVLMAQPERAPRFISKEQPADYWGQMGDFITQISPLALEEFGKPQTAEERLRMQNLQDAFLKGKAVQAVTHAYQAGYDLVPEGRGDKLDIVTKKTAGAGWAGLTGLFEFTGFGTAGRGAGYLAEHLTQGQEAEVFFPREMTDITARVGPYGFNPYGATASAASYFGLAQKTTTKKDGVTYEGLSFEPQEFGSIAEFGTYMFGAEAGAKAVSPTRFNPFHRQWKKGLPEHLKAEAIALADVGRTFRGHVDVIKPYDLMRMEALAKDAKARGVSQRTLMKEQELIAGGSHSLELGMKKPLKRMPKDLDLFAPEWNVEEILKRVQAETGLTKKGKQIYKGSEKVLEIHGTESFLYPSIEPHAGAVNFFGRGVTEAWLAGSGKRIKVVAPDIAGMTKIYAGYLTNVGQGRFLKAGQRPRFKKDIPAAVQFYTDVAKQKEINVGTNIPIYKQYLQYRFGRARERLKSWQDLLYVEEKAPTAYRQLVEPPLFKWEWFREQKPGKFLNERGYIDLYGKPRKKTKALLDYDYKLPDMPYSKAKYARPKPYGYKKGTYKPAYYFDFKTGYYKYSGKQKYSPYGTPTKPYYPKPSKSYYGWGYTPKGGYVPPYAPTTYGGYYAPYKPKYPPYTPYKPGTPPKQPPYVPPPKLPPIKWPPPGWLLGTDKPKKKKTKREQAYNVMVRERGTRKGKKHKRGKFVKVNRVPLTESSALGLGATATDKTVARTFRLRKAQGKPKDKYPFVWNMLAHKFRPVKRKGKYSPLNPFVERTGYAIDTLGEHKGITVQGWKAQRRKRQALNLFGSAKPRKRANRRTGAARKAKSASIFSPLVHLV